MKEIYIYGIYNSEKKFKRSIYEIYRIGILINNAYTPYYVSGIYKKIYSKDLNIINIFLFLFSLLGIFFSIFLIYSYLISNRNILIGNKNVNFITDIIYFIPIIFEIIVYISVHMIYIIYLYYSNLFFTFGKKKNYSIENNNNKFIIELKIYNKNDLLHIIEIFKRNNVYKFFIL